MCRPEDTDSLIHSSNLWHLWVHFFGCLFIRTWERSHQFSILVSTFAFMVLHRIHGFASHCMCRSTPDYSYVRKHEDFCFRAMFPASFQEYSRHPNEVHLPLSLNAASASIVNSGSRIGGQMLRSNQPL